VRISFKRSIGPFNALCACVSNHEGENQSGNSESSDVLVKRLAQQSTSGEFNVLNRRQRICDRCTETFRCLSGIKSALLNSSFCTASDRVTGLIAWQISWTIEVHLAVSASEIAALQDFALRANKPRRWLVRRLFDTRLDRGSGERLLFWHLDIQQDRWTGFPQE